MNRANALLASIVIVASGCDNEPAGPAQEPLRVVRTVPWPGASGVPLDVVIQVEFQREVQLDRWPSDAFLLNGSPLQVREVHGATVTLQAANVLEFNHRYRIDVDRDAWQGNPSAPAADLTWTFTTDPGPPGMTWSREASGTTAELTSVSSSPRGLLVTGDWSTLLFSWNGGAWVQRTYTVPQTNLARVYRRGGNLDLLIDAEGGLYRSYSDGLTWLPRSSVAPEFIARGLDVGPVWVVVGVRAGANGEGMVVTPDYRGFTRTYFLFPGQSLNDVYWDDVAPLFVVVGAHKTILISEDGWPWNHLHVEGDDFEFTAVTGGPWLPGRADVDASDSSRRASRYVAVGSRVAYFDASTYGVEISSFVPPATLRDVAWTGACFVTVGDQGTVASSVDGISWTLHDPGTRVDLRGVSSIESRWIIVGAAGTILVSPALTPL